jgi:diaminohydroxyphosphoribosylaminopyrimidine deaminase/5-amino-6-(5-phosphoribosylamino)uracil reductase
MTAAADQAFMERALELAGRGAASTDPNPAVGCVIVAAGRVVGEGFTQPAGGHHAEIEALTAAGAAAAGATVYVSLEPCAHSGRTGPCTEALRAARVARVVYAIEDPNPAVSGNGARQLAAAGIDVAGPLLAAQAEAVNRGFFARMRRGRPWLRCKQAASLDGRTALAGGESQWITGAAARADGHRWRARSSAVMTGIGTILADDPALTARPDDFEWPLRQPLRVIIDTHLRTPPTAAIFGHDGDVVIFCSAGSPAAAARRGALLAAGATVEAVPGSPRLDLAAVLQRLGALEINSVWLEAGPTLAGAMLAAGLVDEIVLYLAPCLLGHSARGLFELPPLGSLADRHALSIDELTRVGEDLRIVARPAGD